MEAVPVGTVRYFDTAWQIWIYLTLRAHLVRLVLFSIIIDSRLRKQDTHAKSPPSPCLERVDEWAWTPINIDLKWLMRISFCFRFRFCFKYLHCYSQWFVDIQLHTHLQVFKAKCVCIFWVHHTFIHMYVYAYMCYTCVWVTLKSAWFGSWCHLLFLLVLFLYTL